MVCARKPSSGVHIGEREIFSDYFSQFIPQKATGFTIGANVTWTPSFPSFDHHASDQYGDSL